MILQEMNKSDLWRQDLLTVGETWERRQKSRKLYSNPARHELSMVFQFEHSLLDNETQVKRNGTLNRSM